MDKNFVTQQDRRRGSFPGAANLEWKDLPAASIWFMRKLSFFFFFLTTRPGTEEEQRLLHRIPLRISAQPPAICPSPGTLC